MVFIPDDADEPKVNEFRELNFTPHQLKAST